MHTVLYCAYPGSLAINSRQVFEQNPNYQLHLADSRQPLPPQAASKCPDLIVIACARFNGALGEQCSQLCRDNRFPVLMLCDEGDGDSARLAIDSGLTTFITGALNPERLDTIVATTLARHRREQQMTHALDSARQKLSDRAVIEAAKGLLMQSHQISESQAYGLLRQRAMQRQQKLADLARQLVQLQDLR